MEVTLHISTINRSTQINLPNLFVSIICYWIDDDITFFLFFFSWSAADAWISNETFIAERPEFRAQKSIWRLVVEWFHPIMVWHFLSFDPFMCYFIDYFFPTFFILLFIWNVLTYIGKNIAKNACHTLSKILFDPSNRGCVPVLIVYC